jgi:hypothetical protein
MLYTLLGLVVNYGENELLLCFFSPQCPKSLLFKEKKIELAGFELTTSCSASVHRNAQKAFVILKTLEFRSIQFSFSQSVFRQTAITLGNISRQKNR